MFQGNKEEKAIQKLNSIDFNDIYDNDNYIFNDINGAKRFTVNERFNTYFYEVKESGVVALVINGKSTLDITSEDSAIIKEKLMNIGKMSFSKNLANSPSGIKNLAKNNIDILSIKTDRFNNVTVNDHLCQDNKEVGLNIFQALKKVSIEKFATIKNKLLSNKKSNKNTFS